MTQDNTAFAGFIRKMNIELFMKIARGQFDVADDMAKLDKYLALATQINSPEATGNLLLTVFLLHISVGRFSEAIATMDNAFAAFSRATDPMFRVRVLGCAANQGEVYHMLGDYESAIEKYRTTLSLADTITDVDVLGDRYILWANIGTTLLAQELVEEAFAYFSRMIKHSDSPSDQYNISMVDAYIGMTEVHLCRGEQGAALDAAGLAVDIAQRLGDERRLFFAHCARAHVEAARSADAEPHYTAALAALSPTLRSAYNIVALLEEARYHKRHRNLALAARFAALANVHFRAVDLHAFEGEINPLVTSHE